MNLARDRDIGISEYAPGAEIIADGKLFRSRGVVGKRISSQESLFEPKKYVTCYECRRLKQFPLHETPPRNCECRRPFPKPRIYIIPEGFSTYIKDQIEDPRFRRILPPPNSEVFLVEGAMEEDFATYPDEPGLTLALKKGGKLFRANMGFKRNQFRVCMNCGMVIETGSKGEGHSTLWGNKCSAGASKIKPVDLAHEYKTDVLEIRFAGASLTTPSINDRSFWVSFLSSFLNGVSRRLSLDHGDLAGIYHRVPETSADAELVIYDRIPGGAGYLQRIIENLKDCLIAALDVVKNCKDPECNDLDSSCYACLRSYNNQFDWNDLRRRPVIDWLSRLV